MLTLLKMGHRPTKKTTMVNHGKQTMVFWVWLNHMVNHGLITMDNHMVTILKKPWFTYRGLSTMVNHMVKPYPKNHGSVTMVLSTMVNHNYGKTIPKNHGSLTMVYPTMVNHMVNPHPKTMVYLPWLTIW